MGEGEDLQNVESPRMTIDDSEDEGDDQQAMTADEEVLSTSNEATMNHSFRHYFCIFCDSRFDDLQNAFDHFKEHMSNSYYCKVCDYKLSNVPCDDEVKSATCNLDHSQQEVDISKECTIIEMWIERFLSYQDEIQNKTDSNVITSTKFFLGCPACDVLIKECNVPVPKDVLEYREATYQSTVAQFGASLEAGHAGNLTTSSSPTVPLFGGGKESVKCHTVRHACAHLRYYPYECVSCEEVGKYQKKPDISEMMRHIKDSHLKNNFHMLLNQPVEQLVKFVRITKLERFIEYYLKAHPMVRFDPVPSSSLTKRSSSKSQYIVSPSSGKMSHTKSIAALPQQQPRVPSILIKKTTSGSCSTYETAQSNHSPVREDHPSVSSRVREDYPSVSSRVREDYPSVSSRVREDHPSVTCSDPQGSNNLQQSPIRALSRPIHKAPRTPSSSMAETNRSNFHRQFGNIFDEEE